MTVAVSYPGVYVQEISSGVHTIVGVGTSIALFVGRAKAGQMYVPVQCLSYDDFVRAFTEIDVGSDMMRAVKLFFTNGGTQCYAMRIADSTASASTLTLLNEAKAAVLVVQAKSEGLFGDDIRIAVDYDTPSPESTFNLQVFRWTRASTGALQQTGMETYVGLSMDPHHPRYAQDIVNRASSLIELTDKLVVPAAHGFSQSGYALSAKDDATFYAEWKKRIGTTAPGPQRLRVGVDGGAPVDVDLAGIDFVNAVPPFPVETPAHAVANLPSLIAKLINDRLPAGTSVAVTMSPGPGGPVGETNITTVLLRVTSGGAGDVVIEPSGGSNLAVALMLGTAQGGLEVSRFASVRPAPSGFVTTPADAAAFAVLTQVSFDHITVSGKRLDLSAAGAHAIHTTTNVGVHFPEMYQDASATTQDNGRDGIREKLAIMAGAINDAALADSTFNFAAEVWGERLAILPTAGSDNTQVTLTTDLGGAAGPAIFGVVTNNVRYYALGISGTGTYQAAGASGSDGGTPQPPDYDKAYKVVDREVDLFNLLVLPKDQGHTSTQTRQLWGPASVFCRGRRAFLLIDPPDEWVDSQSAVSAAVGVNTLRVGLVKDYSAAFFPRLQITESNKDRYVGPSGAIAGLMARIDSTRGVWKAPAGTEADIRGITGVEYKFSDGENGVLNPKAVNTIRVFANGIVNWGARTMDGDDGFGSEYKYIPIRRLALYIEESLYRGLKWVVFEPNDEPLWAQIRLNVGAFMNNLFRQGAFQGLLPKDAYFVKCDSSTTTQNDRDLGIVNIVVGFAPLYPAEFVVLTLQQMAGQIQT